MPALQIDGKTVAMVDEETARCLLQLAEQECGYLAREATLHMGDANSTARPLAGGALAQVHTSSSLEVQLDLRFQRHSTGIRNTW